MLVKDSMKNAYQLLKDMIQMTNLLLYNAILSYIQNFKCS